MITKIIGMVIGILILGAGIYYFAKEKNDKESRKIYTTISIVGGLIFAVSLLLALFVK